MRGIHTINRIRRDIHSKTHCIVSAEKILQDGFFLQMGVFHPMGGTRKIKLFSVF